MKNQASIEDNNLVMFPSAKNFPLKESLSDPMYELLNEYAHISEKDLPSYIDNRFEDDFFEEEFEEQEEVIGDELYPSLEAFLNRHKAQDGLTPDDLLIKKINDQIKAINEAKERIKFYLDELDIFMPRRR